MQRRRVVLIQDLDKTGSEIRLWRRVLIQDLDKRVKRCGCDGVFLSKTWIRRRARYDGAGGSYPRLG
jgi:hypothetical protein